MYSAYVFLFPLLLRVLIALTGTNTMLAGLFDFRVGRINPGTFGAALVLATGPGNPPAVRFLASGSVWFGSLPGQKPEPLCLGGFVTRTGPKPCVFWPGRNRTVGPFRGSYIFGSN